jgi:hypothetical protein
MMDNNDDDDSCAPLEDDNGSDEDEVKEMTLDAVKFSHPTT